MRHRYSILFYSLLLILVAVPVLNMFKSGAVLIESLLAANLLAAIMPVNLGKNRSPLLTLMIVVWLARPLALWLDQSTLSVITFGIWTLIGLTAAAAALRFAFRATTINAEHVYAALSAYLLAGLYFRSFLLGPRTAQIRRVHRIRKFFPNDDRDSTSSYVTLATLGYGDIAPRTDVARSVAILEGVGGQLFLAVLVAQAIG